MSSSDVRPRDSAATDPRTSRDWRALYPDPAPCQRCGTALHYAGTRRRLGQELRVQVVASCPACGWRFEHTHYTPVTS